MDQQSLSHGLWNFVACGLIIYFVICILIFLQTRQKTFLYYGLYNVFLFLYVVRLSPYLSDAFSDDIESNRFSSLNWFVQVLYNSFMFFFYLEFLEYKKHFRKSYSILILFLRSVIWISALLALVSIYTANVVFYAYYFMYVFIPLITFFVIYGMYFTIKINNKLKYFIIAGVFSYQFLAYTAFIKSMQQYPEGEYPIIYFYIGIIIESIIFLLGLAYKIRQVYFEKLHAQQKVIEEQIEIQLLRENYQKELEKELSEKILALKDALQKNEEEKIKTLSLTFENEIANLKLDSLRSQMNPHFIFNAINSIKAFFIDNDTENAIFYLTNFAMLIRKILESSRKNSISLGEELEIIEIYLSIESMRFSHKVDFKICNTAGDNALNLQLPGIILQPFIENSLWHGLMLREGDKTIRIDMYRENEMYKLSITDNGIGRIKSSEIGQQKTYKKESLGIKFAGERLNYFNRKHGTAYTFKITDLFDEYTGEPSGTCVLFNFQS